MKNRSVVIRLVAFVLVAVSCFLFTSCICRHPAEKEYHVDKIIVYGKEYANTGEVLWQDGIMVFDLAWVLEKMGVELNWVDNTATFTLFDTDYVLDLDAQILRKQNIPEQSKEKRNLLDPGAGRYFVGIINDILYVDSNTLTFALYDLKLYSWIEKNSKNNSVSLVNNPNYQHGS